MTVLVFTLLLGAWIFLIAGQLEGFWQVGTYVIAAWFLFAALWNAWQMSRED
jgi:hypothetical protein